MSLQCFELMEECGMLGEDSDRGVVLVADDDRMVRVYVKTIVEQAGLSAILASDGREALSLFASLHGEVDLLITDVRMPRMTGPQLVAEVRQQTPRLPVVYISAEPGSDLFHDPSDGLAYLEKPFRPEDLIDTIEILMRFQRVSIPPFGS